MKDLFPVKAEVKAEVKADLTKVADSIADISQNSHKGIGKLFYALLGPWIENRVGNAKKTAAQANRDSLDILAGKKQIDAITGQLLPISNEIDVEGLCQELEHINAACKSKRLAAAVMTAATEIRQIPEEEISDKPLNQTFFNHWREEAELIDDEELRSWWSHLLAEEVRNPESISPRTLDVAKNLSRDEARLFETFSKGVVLDDVVLHQEGGHTLFGNFSIVLQLQEAGLLRGECSFKRSANHVHPVFGDQILIPFFAENFVIIIDQKELNFPGYTLTRAGREIRNIFSYKRSLNDMVKIARTIIDNKEKLIVSIHKIVSKQVVSSGNISKFSWNSNPEWTNRPPATISGAQS